MPEAFGACMEPVRRAARAGEYADVDSGTLLEKVLKLYMKIRGKDAIKTLMSDLKASFIDTSQRGEEGAIAGATHNQTRRRSSDVDSEFPLGFVDADDLGAVDMDLAEATEEFSYAPKSNPCNEALTLPIPPRMTSSTS